MPGLRVRDVLGGDPTSAGRDGALVEGRRSRCSRSARRRPPALPGPEPIEPQLEETAGKRSQMATFTDLLRTDADADLFEELATTVPLRVDPDSGAATELGPPGLYYHLSESPDGEHLLVYRLQRPFSFRVPFPYFARRVEVWSAAGELERVIADLPVSDEVPRQGVPTGPRMVSWEESVPASLVWTEAQDGGDPLAKAEHRDQIFRLPAPFDDVAAAVHPGPAPLPGLVRHGGAGPAAGHRARPGPPLADIPAGRPGRAATTAGSSSTTPPTRPTAIRARR